MVRVGRYLATLVVLLGVVAIVVGAVFVAQGIDKSNWMEDAMRVESLTFGLDEAAVAKGELVDSAGEAESAADTIREHRRGISPSYEELLGGGRYDPTNPEHLSYAQALNLENYLYLAVLGFGVTDVVIGIGVFMILMGIALSGAGVTLLALARRAS